MADDCPMGCGGEAYWDAIPEDPCPICGDNLCLRDREGHMWDEHGDEPVSRPGDGR